MSEPTQAELLAQLAAMQAQMAKLQAQLIAQLSGNSGIRQVVVTCRARAHHGDTVLPEEFRVVTVQPMTGEHCGRKAHRCTMAPLAVGNL